jgi:hypothetical protein
MFQFFGIILKTPFVFNEHTLPGAPEGTDTDFTTFRSYSLVLFFNVPWSFLVEDRF